MHFQEFGLEEVISPMSRDTFLREYWEKKPAIIPEDNPCKFDPLLRVSDIDWLFANQRHVASTIRILKSGKESFVEQVNTQGRVMIVEEIYREYREGATIVLQAIHERNESLKQFCRNLASHLTARTHVNAYITPPAGQGLSRHYDTHDVFVLQVFGEKRWKIYDNPIALPLPSMPHGETRPDPGEVLHDVVLAAGDVMYIPRGYIHEAETEDVHSAHLTVGLNQIKWSDIISVAVKEVFETEDVFRQALPPGFVLDQNVQKSSLDRLSNVLGLFSSKLVADEILARVRNDVSCIVEPDLAGHFLDLIELENVGVATKVRVRKNTVFDCFSCDDRSGLRFHGKEVMAPLATLAAFEFICENQGQEFSAEELPGPLDLESKVLLVKKLTQEGLLRIQRHN